MCNDQAKNALRIPAKRTKTPKLSPAFVSVVVVVFFVVVVVSPVVVVVVVVSPVVSPSPAISLSVAAV